jgi:stage V sporulation protein SpoVS
MDWGKVIYVFFSLMSLTTTAGFLFDHNTIALFIAAAVNVLSTILKIGVRNLLAAELLASSLVADLHLIPAFFFLQISGNIDTAIALAIGAVVANLFSISLVLIESSKARDDEY